MREARFQAPKLRTATMIPLVMGIPFAQIGTLRLQGGQPTKGNPWSSSVSALRDGK
jgi:hypothetical protein